MSSLEKNGKHPLNRGVVTLGWVSFLNDTASEMIYPLLPDFITRVLGAGPAALGLIEGVAEATASLAKAAAGWWSDKVRRRKPFVVIGYSIATVARPLTGLAASWAQVLVIRFSDRLGKGLRTPPRDALLADLALAESRGRAYGLQRAMDNAGGSPADPAALLRASGSRMSGHSSCWPSLREFAVLLLVPGPGEKGGAFKSRRARRALGLFAPALDRDRDLPLHPREFDRRVSPPAGPRLRVPVWQLSCSAFFNGAKAAVGFQAAPSPTGSDASRRSRPAG